jgi:hypothetical protein
MKGADFVNPPRRLPLDPMPHLELICDGCDQSLKCAGCQGLLEEIALLRARVEEVLRRLDA